MFGNVKFEKQVLENPRVDKFDGEGMLDESLNRDFSLELGWKN